MIHLLINYFINQYCEQNPAQTQEEILTSSVLTRKQLLIRENALSSFWRVKVQQPLAMMSPFMFAPQGSWTFPTSLEWP
jgi:hypothetical protein